MSALITSREGMAFYWWDEAVSEAHRLAVDTEIRHRVFAGRWGWTVAPVVKARLRAVK